MPFIDGLRAVAVLSVITYHLHAAWLPGGFTGVDIFFVISGYVVSSSVAQLGAMRVGHFAAYFYARRLFRIGPALIACLLAATLAAVLFIPFSWLSNSIQRTGIKAFFGLSNFILADNYKGYFSPRADFNPFTHTWSLAVEEQYYLIFPFLFLPWLHGWRRASIFLASFGFILSLGWACYLGSSDPDRAFYMITSRFWELAAGMLLLQAQSFAPDLVPAKWRALVALAAAAMLLAGLVFTAPASTPFPGGLLPVAGTAALLACLSGDAPSLLRRMLEVAPMRFIGKISYSLYLWHWPVFVLFRWTCGLQDAPEYCSALAIVIALSLCSYYLIEIPPRRLLPMLRVPRYVPVLAGVAGLWVASAIASGLWALQPHITLSTVARNASDWYPDHNPPAAATACKLQQTHFDIPGMRVFQYRGIGCAPGRHIFMLGDSHTDAYVMMAKLLALREGAAVNVYAAGGCGFLNLLYPLPPSCEPGTGSATADIAAKARPGDVLFLASLRVPRISDLDTVYGLAAAQAQAKAAGPVRQSQIKAALPLLHDLAARHVVIILEAPTPVFASTTYRCADWFDRANPICTGGPSIPRATIEAMRAPILQGYATLQASVAGIEVWDPMAVLCPGAICSEYDGAKPLFFDSDHLSGYANQLLEPDFSAFLKQMPR